MSRCYQCPKILRKDKDNRWWAFYINFGLILETFAQCLQGRKSLFISGGCVWIPAEEYLYLGADLWKGTLAKVQICVTKCVIHCSPRGRAILHRHLCYIYIVVVVVFYTKKVYMSSWSPAATTIRANMAHFAKWFAGKTQIASRHKQPC